MHPPTSEMTGTSPAAAPRMVATTSSRRLGRLVLFGLTMIVTIGAAAALPLWLLG